MKKAIIFGKELFLLLNEKSLILRKFAVILLWSKIGLNELLVVWVWYSSILILDWLLLIFFSHHISMLTKTECKKFPIYSSLNLAKKKNNKTRMKRHATKTAKKRFNFKVLSYLLKTWKKKYYEEKTTTYSILPFHVC